MRRLNLDQLQTLVTIADLGTLAAAAKALHLSPSTVSLHVQELEARFNTQLLIRDRRQARLTSAGEALISGGRRLLSESDALQHQVQQRAMGLMMTSKLGVSAGVSPLLLPSLLDWLAVHAPGLELRLEVVSSAHAIQRVATGSLDLALIGLPQADWPQVHITPWRNDPMVAFLPPKWDAPEVVTPEWLNSQRWISFATGSQMYRLLTVWFAEVGLTPQPSMEMSHPEAIRTLVSAGHAMTVLPREAPMDAISHTLQQRELSPALMRPMGLVQRLPGSEDTATQLVVKGLMQFASK